MQPSQERFQSRRQMRGSTIVLLTVLVILFAALLAYNLWQLFGAQEQVEETPPQQTEEQLTLASGVNYGAQNDIQENLLRLQQGSDLAAVVTRDAAPGKKIALTVDGMLDSVTMLRIVDILKQYDMQATFFISGMQATEDPDTVREIAQAGFAVGNYALRAEKHMETFEQETMVESLSCANRILMEITGRMPQQFKGNVTEYTEPLLEAVKACTLPEAVQSTFYLTYHSFRTYEDVQAYVDKLAYRSIVSIKLSGQLDASEYVPKEVIERPAIDLQPGAKTEPQEELLSSEERLLRMLEWLMQSLVSTNFSPEYEELRQKNDGKLADPVKGLNTAEPAVAYVFYGLGRIDELSDVLSSLSVIDGVGTFFVTAKEIEDYPEQIRMIKTAGHTVGIAIFPKKDAEYYGLCHELLKVREALEKEGFSAVRLVLQPWGECGEAVREAVSAIGGTLVSYDLSFARNDNRQALSAQQVVNSVYKDDDGSLHRGQVTCFRLNYFDRRSLMGELIEELSVARNVYAVRGLDALLADEKMQYTYPLPTEQILPQVRDRIYRGQLQDDFMERIVERYIGNRDVAYSAQFPGFSSEEIALLDKTGKIPNKENAVFLTFDDWGTDKSITDILNVLEKHNVKATFFVRTQYVVNNPNLLRAIALAGHEVASHTNIHMPLAHDQEGKWSFTSITEEEALALKDDLEESYRTLQSIIGDITLENGKPALSRLFRPPTMAVSREGMEAVLDCGFTYIINGSYTSRDYLAANAVRLARNLRSNIRSGSVAILHMSASGVYTAEALDLFLTENEGSNNPYNFVRLSDYLAR